MSRILWQHDKVESESGSGLIGVDEAGRGCLAGPVYAAAVYLSPNFFINDWETLAPPKIDDSKKLSIADREKAMVFLDALRSRGEVRFATGTATVEEIDAHNILGATTLAMGRALEGLQIPLEDEALPLWSQESSPCKIPATILIDGRPVKHLAYPHKAIVQGDGKSLAIALASIVAKVGRDRWMEEAHQQFPVYGWKQNRGYGTAVHRQAIVEHGPTPFHRKLFLRKVLSREEPSVSG
tara:strand:- start:4155 stop:4871 length:717 start_codon:yes stop_codon:yes gene_type:complete